MAGQPDSSNPKHRIKLTLGLFVGLVFLTGVGLAAHMYYVVGGPWSDTTVLIEKGSSVRQTATALVGVDAIKDRGLFALATRLTGADRSLRAGEYRIRAGATMAEVVALLKSGQTVPRWITVPEGYSVLQVMTLLAADPALSGVVVGAPREGTLLPETYRYGYGDSRAKLLIQMQADMKAVLTQLWPERKAGLPIKTVDEAVILASIVEKETAVPEERARIAGVFMNRLAKRMQLQSDPTIVYGITGGLSLGRPLRKSELERPTPYNTYVVAGLPPGPIANPGLESLKAVLNPMETDELYFVADGTGGHAFAVTYKEHQRNVRRWRKIENNTSKKAGK